MCRANSQIRPGLTADISKTSVMQVQEHGVRLPVLLLQIGIGNLVHMRVGGEQVFIAVVVQVINTCSPAAHAHTLETDTRLVVLRTEEAVAFVAQQRKRLAPKRGK